MEVTGTVRRTNAEGEGHESKLLFCSTEEGVKRALAQSAGKLLLLSDGGLALAGVTAPRTISAVFDGDALPLFSMPDGVSRVLAAGGRDVLTAARYFAEVRGISCTLFPSDARLHGVFEKKGELLLGGVPLTVPLKEGEAVCDTARMKPTFANAYARILLIRLAKIETEALNAIKGSALICPSLEEEPQTERELLEAGETIARGENAGAYAGEGTALARLLEGEPFPCWSACLMLSALYAAFFAKGKPRRYFTPDYRARAVRAGTDYASANLPSREEYVRRALALEGVRARFTAQSLAFLDGREAQSRALAAWTERAVPMRCGRTDLLQILPEHAPGGLSAVIRDFGLMEWDHDKRRTLTRG